MKYAEAKRMLAKSGCHFVEHGKKHDKWYSPITRQRFLVARHDGQDIKPGTLEELELQ